MNVVSDRASLPAANRWWGGRISTVDPLCIENLTSGLRRSTVIHVGSVEAAVKE